MPSKGQKFPLDDPLARAIAPPQFETTVQRHQRLAAEHEAKRVSDAIDDELNKQRIADKRGPKAIKILLLGQSESGKSTTLKNFQLMNSPKAFLSERASWRTVIQLNVVQSIHAILDLMSRAHSLTHTPSSSTVSANFITTTPSRPTTASKDYPPLTPDLLKLKMRLAPLLRVESALLSKLHPHGHPRFTGLSKSPQSSSHQQEFNPDTSPRWKGTLTRLIARDSHDSTNSVDWSDPDDPSVILSTCTEDMKRLWADPSIKKMMELENMRPEEMAGFFLDALDRVTSPQYIPTDDDVLRARLKTLGASEHRFTMKTGLRHDNTSSASWTVARPGPLGSPASHDWRVFDVGGQRSLRASWVPYFDDMNAIIFLAPISCFNQVLEEDPAVNRLADSFLLWKSIVSNPLLKKTDLVLFLNKCDILRAKLASGIRIADYIVSYGRRPNDFESASIYLKKKFGVLLKEHSPDRQFYCHFTSVTDTKSTSLILSNVQDVLVRDNLRKSALLA